MTDGCNILDQPIQLVNYDNGSQIMYAAVLPLAVSLSILGIEPSQENWEQVSYIRILYNSRYAGGIMHFDNQPIKYMIECVQNNPTIFQYRISFFSTKSPEWNKRIPNVSSNDDIIQFIKQHPPESIKNKNDKDIRVLTIAHTPSSKTTQMLYSGINHTKKVGDLFKTVCIGYSRYNDVVSTEWVKGLIRV